MSHLCSLLAGQEDRTRKRKLRDHLIYEAQVKGIASNLALQVIKLDEDYERQPLPVAYRRSHRILCETSRYKPQFITKSFKDVVDAFESVGLIDHTLGSRTEFQNVGCASLMRPTYDLKEIIWSAGLERSDFGTALPAESIILRDVKIDRFDKGRLIDYPETPETIRLREELSVINKWIAQADISFDMSYACSSLIDTSGRHLRRIFSRNSFTSGGRLFGGFWQPLKKEQRKAGLRINGNRVVTLDYGQMILRMSYGLAGLQPPAGDLYAVGNFGEHREGIKKLISAMLFAEKPLTKFPRHTSKLMPKGYKAKELTQSITRHHPGIAGMFNKGTGHQLMFMESEVLIAVLIELQARSIVALPVHDALIVPEVDASVTTQVMHSVFYQKLGVEAVVKTE